MPRTPSPEGGSQGSHHTSVEIGSSQRVPGRNSLDVNNGHGHHDHDTDGPAEQHSNDQHMDHSRDDSTENGENGTPDNSALDDDESHQISNRDSTSVRSGPIKKTVRFAEDVVDHYADDTTEDDVFERSSASSGGSDTADVHINPAPVIIDSNAKGKLADNGFDRIHQLLDKILHTLMQSTLANRLDHDVRARFWKMYKAEAEEFHTDFLRKYNDEMDISLIFSGLFSAVNATFIVMMLSNLSADPNLTTQVLLMMVVQSLNNTAFAGQNIDLPPFAGPSSMTVWIQSLLYASLAASLFAALGAMLGKQWLGHYARVGERGTVEERCIDRQRKLLAMHTWHFHVVLQCIPLLLQLSLLLFGVGLAAFMWQQQRAIAWVLISVIVAGFSIYTLVVFFSLLSPDCPYHSPIADLLWRLWPYICYPVIVVARNIKRLYKQFRRRFYPSAADDSLALLRSLPTTSPYLKTRGQTSAPSRPTPSTKSTPLSKALRRIFRLREDHAVHVGWTVSRHKGLDARCVDWLLLTSTDSDIITTAARMVVQVDWPVELDLRPMVNQLRDAFIRCFVVQQGDAYHLLPHARDRAAACGQALLHAHMQKQRMELSQVISGARARIEDSVSRHIPHMQPERLDTDWFKHWQVHIGNDDPDLQVICWALGAFSSSPSGYNHSSGDFSATPPNASLMEWFSHNALYCLYDPKLVNGAKLRLGVALAHFFELSPLPHKKVLSNCLMASAMLLGLNVELGQLAAPDNSEHFQQFLQSTLTQLTIFTQRESSRLKFRRGILRDLKSDFAHLLVKPLMDLLIQSNAAESLRDILHHAEFQHWSLRLCRQLVSNLEPSTNSVQRPDWSTKVFQPLDYYIRQIIRLSVMAACPLADDDVDVVFRVWKIRYERTQNNPESLTPDDYPWIISFMGGARMDPDSAANAEVITDCLTLLCEIPNIGFRYDHNDRLFTALSWAMHHPSSERLRHVSLKLARVLCGHQRDVNELLLLSLVHYMGGIQQFSVALSNCPPLLEASGITSYLWVLAYLDIVHALTSREEWHPHLLYHIHQCASFALYLGTSLGHDRWYTDSLDTSVIIPSLGWHADNRSWKQVKSDTGLLGGQEPTHNSYTRDIWYRLVQIMVRCEPLFHAPQEYSSYGTNPYDGDHAAVRLVVACAGWKIYGTHPVPYEVFWKMVNFSTDAVSDAPDELMRQNRLLMQDAARMLSSFNVEPSENTPFTSGIQLLGSLIQRRMTQDLYGDGTSASSDPVPTIST